MYELFLLGKLLERAWYGYEFHQALSGFVGPQRRLSWGTVYPLFQRMERAGLIRPAPRRADRGDAGSTRDKQAYTITAAGRKRFYELMRAEREDDPQFRETFRIKLGHFTRVTAEIRKLVIAHHLERLSRIQEHTKRMAAIVKQIPHMSAAERSMVLLAISHEQALAKTELAWVKKQTDKMIR